MSFDVLHLVRRDPGETFVEAMSRLDESAVVESSMATADLERWDSVLTHVQPLLVNTEQFVGETHRETLHHR